MQKYFLYTIAVFLLAGCQATEDLTSITEEGSIPDQVSFDATMTTTRGGIPLSRITYGRMEKYSSQKMLKFLDGVEIISYDSGLRSSTTLADEASLNELTNEFELQKNVIVSTRTGLQIFADRLVWNEDAEWIHSDGFVRVITAESDTINGQGFESDASFENWVIKKPSGVTNTKRKADDKN